MEYAAFAFLVLVLAFIGAFVKWMIGQYKKNDGVSYVYETVHDEDGNTIEVIRTIVGSNDD